MITFKNIAGNKLLAVGTIQRKSALNGEKSLTGTLYDGKDVLNKIDKGWSLEFDGEPYVVTYFERNDNDNSVSFDAIHKFFWDMTKKVLYSSTEISGSHTIRWYLDQIFANTGYTYALNFSPAAIEKDNWGNKTRLSLFNDLITSIAGEFEINGTLISIFQNIGTDLSTIVRYGFNLSDMTLENDATGFVTYGEGFGAYADQENQTGDRVHVTYTSPLAGVYGILQAEPIDDQRYTSQANLQAAVKAQVDASFSVSVQLSLYDLTAAGYPYKMANVGDWLTAVDENLDFKQRIRIISIDDEFSADGTRISYTVTAGDIGLTKKYQDANASMASQISNAVASASQASTDANNALISANGKNTSYYLNSVDDLPTTANEGDLAWVESGDGTVMYIYTKKADGSYYWEKRIDPEMVDQISAGVTEAVAQANAHTDEVKQGLSTDISTAKSQAASQASSAEANAKSAATSQFNQAQNALSAAKTDLTDSIASEASARNTAVAAANSQARTYANQAKADAMSAASSADGVIRTAISSSANSLSSTITQNKSSADSGISTAQTTAQQAVDGLKTKVSQTDYNAKTGQLQTDLTTTTQTANQAKTDIVSIKQKDSDQDAKMNSIVSDANGTKQTVSDLQTTQGKQSGDISTLQQRADGFDATVTKVDNLSTGDRNYILDTANPKTQPAYGKDNQDFYDSAKFYSPIKNWGIANGDYVISFDWTLKTALSSDMQASVFFNKSPWQEQRFTVPAGQLKGHVDLKFKLNPGILTATNDVTGLTFRIHSQMASGNAITYSSLFMKSGTINTTWTPAPEDLSGATAKAQLTADNATLTINNYKQDADGRINKAQSDITATAQQVATKVSQNDYDIKTGHLTTSVSKAQQTADAATTSLANYKTDADGRISANSADIVTNANAIKQKVAQSDYDANNTKLTSRLTTVETTANGTATTVSNLQQTVNSLGQTNLINNSEFSPDLRGWSMAGSGTYTTGDYDYSGAVLVLSNTGGGIVNLYSSPVSLNGSSSITISWKLNYYIFSVGTNGSSYIYLQYLDSSLNPIPNVFINPQNVAGSSGSGWKNYIVNNFALTNMPTGAKYIRLVVDAREKGSKIGINKPMLTLGTSVGTYVAGAYNNNAALAQVKITADSISNFVRDSSGNISSDFQTALGKTSIITGSTLATSIQKQTATQITSALTDNNGKIISLINQDTSGVQIAGKNIILDGNTTVTGDFYAKGGNFKNLNASNMTVGTLNGTNVNITNINANNIVSGAISGANLNINLNTGSVVFQKGRINSSDYTTDINIDQGYISTANGDTRAILKKGQLQLTSPDYYDLQTNPYLSISNDPRTLESGGIMYGAVISARDRVVIGNADGIDSMLGDTFYLGQSSFYGLSSGKTIGRKIPTVVGGGANGVVLVGGSTYTNTIGGKDSPSIIVGWSSGSSTYSGNRVRIDADYFHVGAVYNRTSSASSNVVVAQDGALVRSSSARKYKLDIKNNIPIDDSLKLIEVPLSTWVDKHEHEENGSNERYFGMIAEDLRDAGLEYLVQYGNDNEVEGINYDRVALLLIPLVKELKKRIEELESKGK